MPEQSVVFFPRRPCRAWLIEPLDDEVWYSRRIGVGQSGLIVTVGTYEFVRQSVEDAEARCGLPIITVQAHGNRSGVA